MPSARLATGLVLSYVDHGNDDGPAVLLLPGPTDSCRSYQGVLDRLPSSIRAIAVSQRGHGDSDKPASGYRIDDFAADVVALLDALELDRAVLAGHSGSCLSARRVAIDRPDRVAGLVLEASPTTLRGHAGLTEFVDTVVADLADPIGVDFARSFVMDTSSASLTPEAVQLLADDVVKVPPRVWRELFADLLVYDDLRELGRIDAPTLLIWGDADAIVPRAMQERLAVLISGAELVTYPDVGHTPRWESTSRFTSDLVRFVDRCTGGRP